MRVTPKDKKNPDPLVSVTIDPLISQSGVITIIDNSNDLEVITGLKAYREGTQIPITIPFITGQIPNFNPEENYKFDRIFPIDSAGNYFDLATYTQSTQQASTN